MWESQVERRKISPHGALSHAWEGSEEKRQRALDSEQILVMRETGERGVSEDSIGEASFVDVGFLLRPPERLYTQGASRLDGAGDTVSAGPQGQN